MPKILTKKVLFPLLTVGLIIFIPIVCYFGFFAFRKLTLSYNYCGAYGELDGELGWKLKENVSSCISLKNFLTGETYFDSKVHTNNLGFRDIEVNRDVPKNAIIAIGDSFTFGYGLNYEETFPHLLSQQINFPVVNMGVPAYGSASTLLLFERYVKQIKPSIVLYNGSLWPRSICFSKIKPSDNLIPCFWWDDKKKKAELIKPESKTVFMKAEKHVYPAGALTVGYDNWEYFFIIKPLIILNAFKTSVLRKINSTFGLRETNPTGLTINGPAILSKTRNLAAHNFVPNGGKHFLSEPGDAIFFAQIDSVIEYTIRRYAKLAKEHGFVFLVYDDLNAYKPFLEKVNKDFGISIIHIGAREWKNDILDPGSKLPAELRRIPKDGHYAVGMNRLIAKKIAATLVNNSILPITK